MTHVTDDVKAREEAKAKVEAMAKANPKIELEYQRLQEFGREHFKKHLSQDRKARASDLKSLLAQVATRLERNATGESLCNLDAPLICRLAESLGGVEPIKIFDEPRKDGGHARFLQVFPYQNGPIYETPVYTFSYKPKRAFKYAPINAATQTSIIMALYDWCGWSDRAGNKHIDGDSINNHTKCPPLPLTGWADEHVHILQSLLNGKKQHMCFFEECITSNRKTLKDLLGWLQQNDLITVEGSIRKKKYSITPSGIDFEKQHRDGVSINSRVKLNSSE